MICVNVQKNWTNGPLTRYVKLRVAHAPRLPGTFSPPPRVGDPGMHHGTCVPHVPRCMPRSLTSGFLRSRWRGKRSRHSRRMRNPQLYVSGKRPMEKCFARFELQLSLGPISYIAQPFWFQSSDSWQWLFTYLPYGINQIIIDGIISSADGNTSGIMVDDITVKHCELFRKFHHIP